MIERIKGVLISVLAVVICLFTLVEVNNFTDLLQDAAGSIAEEYPAASFLKTAADWLPSLQQEQSKLAVFAMLGMVICFLTFPAHKSLKDVKFFQVLDLLLAAATVFCCGYIVVQMEPAFQGWWLEGQKLGDRAGIQNTTDMTVGLIGLVLVLEATRRSIGLALPILAGVFLLYAYFGRSLPNWAFPHSGMDLYSVASSTFLQSTGIFGVALNVMFKYVFLFVIFGAFLEATGGTQFIIDFSEKVFGGSAGGPAKVSVLGSGLMGSLSGSAVANAVTTGTFTIPMMRNAGFQPHIAGGITAAAASGGALVPPIMGAGAYMMLEIVNPEGGFVAIMKAAILPAILYYYSIFMIVHFSAKRIGAHDVDDTEADQRTLAQLLFSFEGVIFFGALGSLIWFLLVPFSAFRSVTYTLGVIIALGILHPSKRLKLQAIYQALLKSARNGVSLVAASACVGIIIGIVLSTGIAGQLNSQIAGLVSDNLLLALVGIMIVSIFLGMGVPSAVCYLLMATLMGSLLGELGVPVLAAHLFIFYFGMMSMVTPPVALAAYASASIAGSTIMRTAFAAFRFSLVGFVLPFMFIYRPQLLMMNLSGGPANWGFVALEFSIALVGIIALAAGITGFLFRKLSIAGQAGLLVSAALLLAPHKLQIHADDPAFNNVRIVMTAAGVLILLGLAVLNRRQPVSAS